MSDSFGIRITMYVVKGNVTVSHVHILTLYSELSLGHGLLVPSKDPLKYLKSIPRVRNDIICHLNTSTPSPNTGKCECMNVHPTRKGPPFTN